VNRCTAVERLLAELYAGLREAKPARAGTCFADDAEALFIGTDPAEWWVGAPAIRRNLRAMLRDTGGVDFASTEPRGLRAGNTAWVTDRPTFRLPDGMEIPVRVTATACRIEGEWRFVQAHISLGLNSHLPPEVIAITSRPLE